MVTIEYIESFTVTIVSPMALTSCIFNVSAGVTSVWVTKWTQVWKACFIARTHGCVRNDSETHETVLHIVDRRNCDGSCLLNLTQQSCIFFKFAICSIALLNLGETCHLKGRGMVTVWCTVLLLCCYDCESTQQHYDITLLEYVLWRHTMHEWVMNIHYQNMNRPRAIHKHHPHPLETMGHVW